MAIRINHNTRPYTLPEPFYCDPAEVENGISMDLVEKYIRQHEDRLRRYRYLEALYKGFHDIFRQPEKEKWKPDWRLAVNFPRYLTTTFSGYGYGKGIKVLHPDDDIAEGLRDFEKSNEIKGHHTNMVKYCCIYGHAWEYMYQDEEGRTNVTAEKPSDLFVVYDDTMKKRALFGVRYGRHNTGKHKGEIYGEIIGSMENIPFDAGRKKEPYPNPYAPRLCVVEWCLNDERMGLYEPVAGLIELYNHTLSEKSNDIDYFAEAILAVIGAEVEEKDLENMRDKRLVNLYGTENVKDAIVQYLTRPSADGTQENLLTRVERLIYQIAMVANISDESFGSATSGIALAYKLWSTSNIVGDFNTLIEKSIKKRIKLWSSLQTNTTRNDAWVDIEVKFQPNIPRNVQEETQTAASAEGMVSIETQLSLLSYVEDPKAEIEKMKQEEEEEQVSIVDRRMFEIPGTEVTEDAKEDTSGQ